MLFRSARVFPILYNPLVQHESVKYSQIQVGEHQVEARHARLAAARRRGIEEEEEVVGVGPIVLGAPRPLQIQEPRLGAHLSDRF